MEHASHLTAIVARRIEAARRPVEAHDLVCAVIKDGANAGARLLESFDIELPEPAPAAGGPLSTAGLAPDAEHLLAVAEAVARELGDPQVDAEHVVLAAIDGADPVHAGMYRVFGINPALARGQLARLRAGGTDLLAPVPDEAYLDELEAAMHALADEAGSTSS